MEIETEIDDYEENFDSKLTWEDEVDIEKDNILHDYNLAEALATEVEKSKWTYKEQSIYELLAKYANIIYTDMKELTKINIIQHTIHLLNSTLIMQGCQPID